MNKTVRKRYIFQRWHLLDGESMRASIVGGPICICVPVNTSELGLPLPTSLLQHLQRHKAPVCLQVADGVISPMVPGRSWASPTPHTHLELKVCVFKKLLVHSFCKLVDRSQEDPGRGNKVTGPFAPPLFLLFTAKISSSSPWAGLVFRWGHCRSTQGLWLPC